MTKYNNGFSFVIDRKNPRDLEELQLICGIRYAFVPEGVYLISDILGNKVQLNKDPIIDGSEVTISMISDSINISINKPTYLDFNKKLEKTEYDLL
jgi:hypothetical protein